MDKNELYEQLDEDFEGYIESREILDSLVPYDSVAAYRLASELQTIIRQVIPAAVVEKRE